MAISVVHYIVATGGVAAVNGDGAVFGGSQEASLAEAHRWRDKRNETDACTPKCTFHVYELTTTARKLED